jgi:hypothetical protein
MPERHGALNGMKQRRLLRLALLSAVALAISACGGSTDSGGRAADEKSREQGRGLADISVVRGGRSFCGQDLGLGNMDIQVTLRNRGPEAVSVSVTPVRYYSDGSKNDSVMDTFTLDVPANGTETGWISVDVDDDHVLVECAVQLDGGPERPIDAKVG